MAQEDAEEFLKTHGHPWVDSAFSTNCFKCQVFFGLFTRKHHCRRCGNVFCHSCSCYTARINGALKRACMACSRQSIAEMASGMSNLHIRKHSTTRAQDDITNRLSRDFSGPSKSNISVHVKRSSSFSYLVQIADDNSEVGYSRRPLPPRPTLAARPLPTPPPPELTPGPENMHVFRFSSSRPISENSPTDSRPESQESIPLNSPSQRSTPPPPLSPRRSSLNNVPTSPTTPAPRLPARRSSNISPKSQQVLRRSSAHSESSEPSIPTCAVCEGAIVSDRIFRAYEHDFHAQCFKCDDCGTVLGSGQQCYTTPAELEPHLNPQKQRPRLYCQTDFALRFCPRCYKCHRPICEEESITANGCQYHMDCFVCTHCGVPLSEAQDEPQDNRESRVNVQFFETAGQVYCRKDYLELFADRCEGCGFPISGRCVLALNKKWHDECFVCNECELPVSAAAEDGAKNLEFFQVNGLIFCGRHRNEYIRPRINLSLSSNPEEAYQELRKNLRPVPQTASVDTSALEPPASPARPSELRKKRGKGPSPTYQPAGETTNRIFGQNTAEKRRISIPDFLNMPEPMMDNSPPVEVEEFSPSGSSVGSVIDALLTINHALPLALESILTDGSTTSEGVDLNLTRNDYGQIQTRFYVEPRERGSEANAANRTTRNASSLHFRIVQPRESQSSAFEPECFDFEARATAVFANLRALAGITPSQFKQSMCSEALLGGQQGEGKSGMSFFFTHDNRFVIKTVKASEMQFLMQVLQDYYDYVSTNVHTTLLSKFYGLYRVKLRNQVVARLIVMNNVFEIPQAFPAVQIEERYDLKGAFMKRFVTPEELQAGVTTLKDLNFCSNHDRVDMNGVFVRAPESSTSSVCRCLQIGRSKRGQLVTSLMKDTQWLTEHNVMDYSLLLGVAKSPTMQFPKRRGSAVGTERAWSCECGGIVSRDENDERIMRADRSSVSIFYLGIIDILQEFTLKKMIESAYKGQIQTLLGQDPTLISALPPTQYATRFVSFVTAHFR